MMTDHMERRRIPYAVTFGNHDIQCGISNEEQAKGGILPVKSCHPCCFSIFLYPNTESAGM